MTALRILRSAVLARPLVAVGALLLGVLSGGVSLLSPLLVGALVADFAGGRSPVRHAALLALAVLGGAAASGASAYLLSAVGERGVARVRTATVGHALRLPVVTVRRLGAGDMVARVTGDAAMLRSLTDVGVTGLPISVLVAVVSLVLMGSLDWVLLSIVAVTFSAAALVIRVFLRRMRRGNQEQQRAVGALAERLSATLNTLVVVKSCRAEARAMVPIVEQSDAAAAAAIAGARAQTFVSPLMGVAQQVAMMGVLAGSGARLASGKLTVADFVAFMMYMFQLVGPLTMVASGVGRLQLGLSAAGRIDEVLAEPAEEPGAAQQPWFGAHAHALELRSVVAGYDEAADVLHDVSFTVPRTGLTALVGGSGAGKSTVLAVIEKFTAVRHGAVLLYGRALSEWPTAELRRRVAYVDQSFTLVVGTVRENLLLGRDEPAGDIELLNALHTVGMAETVLALPQGLNTVIGTSVDLSGGQRQRLALARAVLSTADVVLLDEPTSQLDGINEQRLVTVVDRITRRRAVVMVAHRLSTVRHADQVVFLHDGRTAGCGTHDQLLRFSPGYRELVRFQGLDRAAA